MNALVLVASVAMLAHAPRALAAACTSAATGPWATAGSWAAPCNVAGGPVAGDTVTILNTHIITVGAAAAAATLTVNAGGSLVNNSTLTLTGALGGTGALTNSATGVLNLGGTATITTLTATAVSNTVNYTGVAQTLKATAYYHLGLGGSGAKTMTGISTVSGNLTTSGTATATTAANFSIGGNLAVGAGTTFTSANFTNSVTGTTSVSGTLAHSGVAAKTYIGAVTINGGGSWTNAGNAPVTFRNGLTHNGATFTSGTGIQTFNTFAQAIGGTTAIAIANLTVTGVTLTNNGTLTVSTALAGTGTLTNAAALSIGGSSAITGLTATAVGNVVNYTGAAAQTIKATTYATLNTSGAGAKSVAGVTVVNNTLSVTGGTVTNNSTLTVTTALSGTGTLVNAGTRTLNIAGTSTITTLTATAVGNIVNYTGAVAQTVKATTYATLNFSGAGVKTVAAATTVTVNTALTGTALTNAGILNIAGTSTITTLTATAVGNIVSYTGGAAQTVKATTYATLNFSGAGVKTNSGTTTVNTALTGTALTNGATGVLNIAGTSGITTLTATAAGNIVNYTGAAAQTVKATTYATLNFSGAGVKTNSGAVTVNTALTGTALTNDATGILSIAGTSTITTLTATAVGNVVNYTGAAAQTIKATTYATLNTSGAGAKSVAGVTVVNNTLSVTGGTVTNNSTLTVTTALSGTGTLVNAGTRTLNIAGTSTITTLTATAAGNIVNYTGAGQTVKATSYATLNITGTATVSGTVTVATALGGAGTLTNDATGILSIAGTSTITTLTATAVGNVVNYTGAAAQTIKATTYATLNTSGAGAKSVAGVTVVNNTLSVTGGTVTNNSTLTVTTALSGTGTLVNAGTRTLNIAGTSTITTLTATAAGNIVNYTGAGQTVKATSYATLNITGTATVSGTVTVATALGGAGTLTNAATGILNIGGSSAITGLTATAVGNVVNYTGAAAQTVKATTYATLNFSGAGVKTNSGATTVNTALTGTALANGATGILDIAGTSTITTLTATAVGNVVNYTGAAAQTIKATTYATLNTSGAGAKSVAGVTVVNNTLSVTGGTVTNNSTLTVTTALSGTGTLVNAGTRTLNIAGTSGITTLTATAAGNVVNYTGAAAQTVKATTYATLNFSGAGVKTNSGTTTVNTALTGTALTNDATGVLSIAGTSTITTLTATAVGNTVNYTGAAQTIKATTYHHLGLAGSLAKTAPAGLSVNGDLTFSGSATFTAGAFTHNFAGNWIVNTTAAAPLSVATTSIINFNTPAIPAATSMGGTTTATIAFADVNINNSSGVTFNDNASFSTGTTPTLTVAAGATLTPAAAVIVSGTGTLTGSGTVQVTRTAAVAGFSQQYTIANKTLTNLTVEYIGAAAQTVSALTYGKLKINNASGVTLAGATTVSTTLTLTDGGVATGANTLTVTGACPASVVVVGGYVVGAIRLTYPASATTTCTYPVGSSATAYTPIILAATTGAGGGTLTGSTTGAEHPQINTSDIDPTRSANRYWSLWSAGDSITLTSYDATFTFVAADVDVGAVPANFDIGKNVGGTWTLPTPVTATATTIAVTGIAGPLSAATAFVVGEGYALFVMSAPDGLGVVAGRPHRLRMTRTKLDGTTTLTGYTGAKNLDGWYAATGNHPGGATAPQVCLGNGTATPCLPATGGSCVTLPNAAPALNAGSNNLSITFASGVADFCVGTADVGQYAVSLRDDSNIAHAVTGTSSTLTARPFAVVVSGIVQGATANPASSSDSSANPFIAGANFSATVGGYLWKSTGTGIAGFGDADGDGVPDASPSFADVVTNGGGIAPRYADTVTLATDTTLPANFAPTAPPAAQGNLTGGTAVAVAAGSASTNTLKYSEVGSFTLKATPASDYLGGGVDLSPRVVIFADGATRNGWVGRFRPDHFVIAAGTSTPACGSFSYFGQDGFTTDFTLTAESADNATTTNYAGTWAKLGLTTWSNFAFAAATLPAGSTFAASTTPPTGTWVGGSAAVSAKHQLSRPTALTGLTSITISALPVDGDTVTLAAAVTVGSAPLRYGRLHLLAAYGSERLPLRVPVRAEYFNGTAWTLNAADSCTAIPQNSVVRATGGIAANLCFLSNPPPAAPTNSSCLAGGSPVLTLANGLGTWIVFDMTPVQVGIADLAVNLGTTGIDTSCNAAHPASVAGNLSWLQFPWCAGKLDPNARIKFGAAKAPYIYLRERY